MKFDIREHKKQQRAHFKAVRGDISPQQKARWDTAIIRHILALPTYRNCSTLLVYLPLDGEINTLPLLEHAWSQGRRVAIPYCVPGTRIVEFYIVHSLDDLVESAYGIPEPDPARHEKLSDFSGCFCLLPGLAFDLDGYRLGYGGGYYDRFLNGPYKGGATAGACYGVCTVKRLTRGAYDRPCDCLVTETGVRRITKK